NPPPTFWRSVLGGWIRWADLFTGGSCGLRAQNERTGLRTGDSGCELFGQDSFLERSVGVEQHGQGDVAALAHLDLADPADLEIVGHGADRALVRLHHLETDLGVVWQQGAAPAPGAKRADGRQGQHLGVQRDDWAM